MVLDLGGFAAEDEKHRHGLGCPRGPSLGLLRLAYPAGVLALLSVG